MIPIVKRIVSFGPDYGLTPQLSAKLVSLAESFDSAIALEYEGRSIRLDSLIGLISVEYHKGDEIVLTSVGSDEEAAADAACALLSEP